MDKLTPKGSSENSAQSAGAISRRLTGLYYSWFTYSKPTRQHPTLQGKQQNLPVYFVLGGKLQERSNFWKYSTGCASVIRQEIATNHKQPNNFNCFINPESIDAICKDQGMSDGECKLFSNGFQLIDKFITTIESKSSSKNEDPPRSMPARQSEHEQNDIDPIIRRQRDVDVDFIDHDESDVQWRRIRRRLHLHRLNPKITTGVWTSQRRNDMN
ncbi:hypothetical protein KIN20_015439 [Parelaphostrongylus tenuis]|uniref:Uncharacterized protein n=1 Tax=Parelaphostrongylus tenuis TaxID=148309 RepID=A0AAD5QM87_PARTN|nr:hypothetical protein KIN20_015439 [Parelaphostrongylus tenuis]